MVTGKHFHQGVDRLSSRVAFVHVDRHTATAHRRVIPDRAAEPRFVFGGRSSSSHRPDPTVGVVLPGDEADHQLGPIDGNGRKHVSEPISLSSRIEYPFHHQ